MPSTPPSLDPSRWVDEHGDALFAYAMSRVRDRTKAEDLVQEALLTALQRQDSYEGRSAERTWLIGILRFKILQWFRVAGREKPESALLDGATGEIFDGRDHWTSASRPRGWPAVPTDGPEREELSRALEACLDKLPPRTREAFLLVERTGAPARQVGQVLDASETHVHVMLHRARLALRACLERSWLGRKEPRP